MEYDGERGGWQQPEITKMENISLHPAARVLHYATTVSLPTLSENILTPYKLVSRIMDELCIGTESVEYK